MRKRLIALILGALAVGLIAGCGSSGSDNGGGAEISTNSLTKSEFIEQANAVCTKHHNKIVAEFEVYVKKHGLPEPSERTSALSAFAEAVIFPALKLESEEFSAIGAPSDNVDEVEAISTSMAKGVEEAEQDKVTGKRPPELEKANELAEKFGLNKDCMVT